MRRERARLDETEAALKRQEDARRDAWRQRETATTRRTDIDELLPRFELLHQHYESDLKRLAAIAEAGTLLVHLPVSSCPLCGALPAHHGESGEVCDGDVTAVADAAKAEMDSIHALRANLERTVAALEAERNEVLSAEAAAARLVSAAQQRIDSFLAVDIAGLRTTYSDLVERQAELRHASTILRRIDELEQKRTELTASRTDEDSAPSLVSAAIAL